VARPNGILLYGMYDISDPRSAPKVRISMMRDAFGRLGPTESVTGGRLARAIGATRWLISGGPGRVGAVYVEAPTSSAMPTDLLFLALMRLLRRPVGVYFRDAYQLFRDVHPRAHRRQIVTDLLWRVTTPLLKRIASVAFTPSAGLASALRIDDAVLLPPGTDPSAPYLGIGQDDVVGAIVQIGPTSGFDRLLGAMEIVRTKRTSARLIVASRATAAASPPDWVDVRPTGRSTLAEVIEPARVCVLPLPVNRYTDLAVAVRLVDFLAFGKPIVATDTTESRALVQAGGAGRLAPDSPEGIAAAIEVLLSDRRLAERCSRQGRAYAEDPANTWDARAATVRRKLRLDRA
jgi:glycosyltransferase involved in cell wall biosynthesis